MRQLKIKVKIPTVHKNEVSGDQSMRVPGDRVGALHGLGYFFFKSNPRTFKNSSKHDLGVRTGENVAVPGFRASVILIAFISIKIHEQLISNFCSTLTKNIG